MLEEQSQIVIGNNTFVLENKQILFEVHDPDTDFYKCLVKVTVAAKSFDGIIAEKEEFFLMIE
ncbi:hypothetical protein C4573_00635 [Candidatus Woesearchaeota archaeon]|nr:MAG: hypothetical protein C4573_00635 [Candidatus Woesearchaeota archaeon]